MIIWGCHVTLAPLAEGCHVRSVYLSCNNNALIVNATKDTYAGFKT